MEAWGVGEVLADPEGQDAGDDKRLEADDEAQLAAATARIHQLQPAPG